MEITTSGYKIEIDLKDDTEEVRGIVTHTLDLMRFFVIFSYRTEIQEENTPASK